jgi:ATP:ADP antiporter, AAA family
MTATARPAREQPLDRLLRLFSDVRAGEGGTAVLLLVNVFLLLTAYYVIKPVRDALILAESGAELKSYASAGQAILLLGLVPLYGFLAAKFPRRRLINTVTVFFTGCLVAFYLFARTGLHIGIVFFLWTGIFNLMVVAQFWSFANDIYSEDEGKRLFPIIAFGASSGAVLGSFITGRLIGPLGVNQLLLFAAALLVVSLIITNTVDTRERRRTESHLPPPETSAELPAITETGQFRIVAPGKPAPTLAVRPEPAPVSRGGAFRLVFSNRYLLWIALLILVLNWVNSTGEYLLGSMVGRVAAEQVRAGTASGLSEAQLIGRFYSDFLSVVNVVSLLGQLFLVSRIIKYLGVRAAIFFLPVISLVGYAALAVYPVLSVVRWAKTAENATDYSLQNTIRNILFLPTSREEKYKAKQAIDSFFVRMGDVLSGVLVYVGTTYLALQTRHFAMVNLVLALGWLGLAFLISRAYQRRSRTEPIIPSAGPQPVPAGGASRGSVR